MKKMSLLMFAGLLTSSYTFSALTPRTARAMTRYYCSTTTPPKPPSLFVAVAGGLGGAITAANVLDIAINSCSPAKPSEPTYRERETIRNAYIIADASGMYGGLRLVGLPRSPAAASAFTGLIILNIAFSDINK